MAQFSVKIMRLTGSVLGENQQSARHTGTDWSRNYVWYPDGRVRRFTPNEVERVQGFPDDWTRPSSFEEHQEDRVDSLRYHAIGNAVTPPVAEWVGRRLRSVLIAREYELSKEHGVAAE